MAVVKVKSRFDILEAIQELVREQIKARVGAETVDQVKK